MSRWTLIVEIQPDPEDIEHPDDKVTFYFDALNAATNLGTVVNAQWVEHDDKEEI